MAVIDNRPSAKFHPVQSPVKRAFPASVNCPPPVQSTECTSRSQIGEMEAAGDSAGIDEAINGGEPLTKEEREWPNEQWFQDVASESTVQGISSHCGVRGFRGVEISTAT
jgi:hypothetical protein